MYDSFTEESIRHFVCAFYADVRRSPDLAEIFAREVEDWAAHEDRLVDFWSTVLLAVGRYKGNPLQVHRALPDLGNAHFERWLALFAETAERVFEPQVAAQLVAKAERMAVHLRSRLGLRSVAAALAAIVTSVALLAPGAAEAKDVVVSPPTQTIDAVLTYAPEVPPPVGDREPAVVRAKIRAGRKTMPMSNRYQYTYWTLNGHSPGPFLRARVGDVLEVHITNDDPKGMPHNLDFHAVTGPGGGANVLTVAPGEERVGRFRLLHPGLFYYHCAAPPVPDHIANGMYGLILVEPAVGLPPVDREYFVMQSEFYTEPPPEDGGLLSFSHAQGLSETPQFVVFNGRVGSLTDEGMLPAKTGETVRLYFGNAGPNLVSSFHVIGEVFDRVYREGDLVSAPARSVQTTLVPSGGATVVEFGVEVPGEYTLVDHSIFRIEKGAAGFLAVTGPERPDLFFSSQGEKPCEGCKVHR